MEVCGTSTKLLLLQYRVFWRKKYDNSTQKLVQFFCFGVGVWIKCFFDETQCGNFWKTSRLSFSFKLTQTSYDMEFLKMSSSVDYSYQNPVKMKLLKVLSYKVFCCLRWDWKGSNCHTSKVRPNTKELNDY